jgi:hypothetical protein
MPLFQTSVPVVALLEASDPQAAIRLLLDKVRQAGLNSTPGGQPGGYATEYTGSSGQGQPANGNWPAAGGGNRWGGGQESGGGRDRWGRGG